MRGRLKVGEPMATPIIRELRGQAPAEGWAIVDAPPGTSCPVIAATKGADHVLLVTEPTPFGLNDLRLAVELMRVLNIPHSVILNRADLGDARVREFCDEEHIPIVMEIPFDREIARGYARGVPLIDTRPRLDGKLVDLALSISAGGAS